MASSRTRRRALPRTLQRSPLQVSAARGDAADPVRVERALETVAAVASAAAASRFVESTEIEIDLVSGDNTIAHALGRTPRGVVLTPKTTVPNFAWSFDWTQPGNPHPQRTATVNVSDDVTARLVFF